MQRIRPLTVATALAATGIALVLTGVDTVAAQDWNQQHQQAGQPAGSQFQGSGTQSDGRSIYSQGASHAQDAAHRGHNDAGQSRDTGGELSANMAVTQTPISNWPPEWTRRPLEPEHDAFINRLLGHWETSSNTINHCTTDFVCWRYDPQIAAYRNPNTHQLAAAVILEGSMRYSKPDKGKYEVNKAWIFAGPPANPGEEPQYRQPDDGEELDMFRTEWITDGRMIYEKDFRTKRLYEMQLPEQYQGQGLMNSPLPFLFGISAQSLRQRYWFRVITPAELREKYCWLEVVPKNIEDARNYQKVWVIISLEDFLPESLHVYPPNFDARTNETFSVFRFQNRRVNPNFANLQDFLGMFIRPQTPRGWERVQRNLAFDPGSAGHQAGPHPPQAPHR